MPATLDDYTVRMICNDKEVLFNQVLCDVWIIQIKMDWINNCFGSKFSIWLSGVFNVNYL